MNKLYVELMTRLNEQTDREDGQGLVEYALIISLVAVAVALLLPGLATAIGGTFATITNSL